MSELSRPILLTPNVAPYAHGSCLVEFGKTKVLVTSMLENFVPQFLKGRGSGWLTAEYGMLPSSTQNRQKRERKGLSGRSQEIQRLIGRSLRAAIDLNQLGERSILIDCDVIVADGGTRTASISGAYVALYLSLQKLVEEGEINNLSLITEQVAAVSVGISKKDEILVDLDYERDSNCSTDMNIVGTKKGQFIEIQGTAEHRPFSGTQLSTMLEKAKTALDEIFLIQDKAIKG